MNLSAAQQKAVEGAREVSDPSANGRLIFPPTTRRSTINALVKKGVVRHEFGKPYFSAWRGVDVHPSHYFFA
jgi:hypothetical protein